MSDEESFKSFIYSENEEDYDYEFPFYRWNVELDREYLEERINEYLKVRYLSEPGNILMKIRMVNIYHLKILISADLYQSKRCREHPRVRCAVL